ncbi:regulatory protein RecX [Winogradskyella helgolandensis]|uniref:regulatory protein RecX n=1 Tax=Winogradskyella helgolandensis TaxID=2697010 RepID=UPI001E524F74|nr:regulatory protein RecX [Winogradskyella helgolandensis]
MSLSIVFLNRMDVNKTYTVDEARKKLEHYCAYQERCHKEVRQKLRDMRMIPEAIDVIMVQLIADNFLNEERFAQAFVRGKFRIKKWGKNRLVRELKFRDISKYSIDTALKEIDLDDYYSTLDELVQKRIAQVKEPNVYKKKKKVADYLLYRGWESGLVYEKLREYLG